MTDNQQRAAEIMRSRAFHVGGAHVLAAALDEAEQRGRAEVAAKVEALADELETFEPVSGFDPDYWAGLGEAADRLRALAAEVAQ
jgi:hypothetical protein